VSGSTATASYGKEEVARLSVPLVFADQFYHRRVHIEIVRQKVRQAQTKLES
jgi:hypothetical protein